MADIILPRLRNLFRIVLIAINGGIFGLGEPMHLNAPLPEDLEPYVSYGDFPWKECFRNLSGTVADIAEAGFSILESGYAPDAWDWWTEFAKHDPFCKKDPDGAPKTLAVDNGRWTSFGNGLNPTTPGGGQIITGRRHCIKNGFRISRPACSFPLSSSNRAPFFP